MGLTFILLHQTQDSLCLTSSFSLSPPPPKNIVLCSVSGFCFSPGFVLLGGGCVTGFVWLVCWGFFEFDFVLNITCLCSSLPSHFSPTDFLSYFFALSSFLPHSITPPFLLFWCFLCSVLSICLSDLFIYFPPLEQLNLKDYRDI